MGSSLSIPKMRGAKWLRDVTYLSDAVKADVVRHVMQARGDGFEHVAVRPGDGGVVVTVGAGEAIYAVIS